MWENYVSNAEVRMKYEVIHLGKKIVFINHVLEQYGEEGLGKPLRIK